MKVYGVDIGSSSIKIAEVESSGNTTALTHVWEIPLSVDPTKDQDLDILERLREFSSQIKATSADAKWVIGVPQSMISARFRRFPFKERAKILKSLPFELDEEIPFDMDETIFDARLVEAHNNATDVMAFACPKEAVEQALSIAKDGGFDASIVAAEGAALGNIIEQWWLAPAQSRRQVTLGDTTDSEVRPAQALLQIGHRRSVLLVHRAGQLISIRSIQWGGHDLAESLAGSFSVPYLEAIKALPKKAFLLLNTSGATRDQIGMHSSMESAMSSLVRDLKLTFLDVRTSLGAEIQDLAICGGGSRLQNLAPWLTQALGIPANNMSVFDALINTGKIQIRFQADHEITTVAGTAIGLALDGVRRIRNPAINFRQGEFAKTNESLRKFWQTWQVTAQITLAIFLVFTAYAWLRNSLAEDLSLASEDILKIGASKSAGLKQADLDAVLNYVTREQSLLKDRQTLAGLQDYVSALEILARIAESAPVQKPPNPTVGLAVSRISIDNEDVSIEGRVLDAARLDQLKNSLQKIARAGSLKTQAPSNPTSSAGTAFNFSFKVDRMPPRAAAKDEE